MTTQRSTPGRRVLHPDQVRDILEGVARDRPELLQDSAVSVSAATKASPTARSDPGAPSLAELTTDLLAGIREPGPAIRATAHRVAKSIQRAASLDHVLDTVPEVATAASWLDLYERVARLRDVEDLAVQRGLLILDSLRDRRLAVHAQVVRGRGPGRGK